MGYSVARCDPENPYRDARFTDYYNQVRDEVFGGQEFGPPPGVAPLCLTREGARRSTRAAELIARPTQGPPSPNQGTAVLAVDPLLTASAAGGPGHTSFLVRS